MTGHLRIVAKRDGFRRAGLAHPDRPVFHRRADLTDEQVAALMDEPMLIVDEMDPPDAATPPARTAKGKAADAAI
ncbi:HI1506-related protein [Azospirillum halopraeferens]|uniref:HI1506-related protein n=1 Tax=Azospirillum halopraeferens TaxID=34010 RepID=UPI0004106E65|nr:HI1506-related protein [Azospirillum halopraeferens]